METSAQPQALLPEGFQVWMYRSIQDSGFVPIFPLTALVGSPESGKTSLLRALQGLDPALAAPYSRDRDWPRHERGQPRLDQVVCAASFRFADELLEQLLRDRLVEPDTLGARLGRTYGGETLVELWSGEARAGNRGAGDAFHNAPAKLAAIVHKHLPAFLYAEPESMLPQGLFPGELAAASEAGDESGVLALAQLLSEVGLGPEELQEKLTAPRVRAISDRLREYLSQRGFAQDLSLELRHGRIDLFLRTRSGERLAVDQLRRADRFRLTLDLRYVAASASGRAQPILLLDAPGRAFRKEPQRRLEAMLEGYVGAGATVLYTARLPFDIDLQYPEQVLVLSPAQDGTCVACPGRDVHEDLAVRAALGMTGRPSFRIAELNLVVEGATDVWIVGALDALFRRSGELALPPDMNLMSVGGSNEVAAVTAFLGRQGLVAIGLVDSDEAGDRAELEFERALRLDRRVSRVEILQLGLAAGLETESATIEDLFPAEFFLAIAREVCGASADRAIARVARGNQARPEPKNSLVRRLSAAFDADGRRFPKARVAKALEGKLALMSTVEDLPDGMAPSVRRLMAAIRSASDRHCVPVSPCGQGDGAK